jgi:hypothetical protein
MVANMNASEYIASLGNQRDTAEVDVVLISLFFNTELHIHYFDGSSFIKMKFNEDPKRKKVRLYLNPGGVFDVVYDKEKIRSAGICQAIVLDVRVINNLVM